MGPHHVAQGLDFRLRVTLTAKVKKVECGSEAEAHHKVLADIEGQDTSSVFLGIPRQDEFFIAKSCLAAKEQILPPLVFGVQILLSFPVAITPCRPQIEHLF